MHLEQNSCVVLEVQVMVTFEEGDFNEEGDKGGFSSDRNSPYLDLGGGYTYVNID